MCSAHKDLYRNIYGILGIPIDSDTIEIVVGKIKQACAEFRVVVVSTPNLNFLVGSLTDEVLRRSLLASDLCAIDGTPIVWLSKLLGIPVNDRVAGADLFDALRKVYDGEQPIKVFLFGGAPGVAEAAANSINIKSHGVICVGTLNPGYCSVEEMSSAAILDTINSSGADFLVISLGAQKGQAWLMHNHDRLTVPVRSHLGAAINFEGGTLKRAPVIFRRTGFEWLWRIREEPYLWRRYWHDGKVFLSLLFCRALPLALLGRHYRGRHRDAAFDLAQLDDHRLPVIVSIKGDAVEANVKLAIQTFERALDTGKDVSIDLSEVGFIDPRFFGLFVAVRKCLTETGRQLVFANVSSLARRLFRLNAFEFLLDRRAF